MKVIDLILELEALPPQREVRIQVVVGGDLVTDDVDIERIADTGDYVRLTPEADQYGTRRLIDAALAAREALEAPEVHDCHAAGHGPCIAACCPIAGQGPLRVRGGVFLRGCRPTHLVDG